MATITNKPITVFDLMKLPLSQRLNVYSGVKTDTIKYFRLDDQLYTGYKGYSFFWELTLTEEPQRAQDGSMDLSNIVYFRTPHLRIDFSLISWHDYKRLRQQMLSKLTFMLTCYDTDFDRMINVEVYFHPDSLPTFELLARKLNGESWTEVLGAKDYTVELVGTNNH